MTKDEINLVLDAVLIGFKAERFMTDADYALQDKAMLILQEALASEAIEQLAQQALNKMAENARELGLDYEPDIPFGDNNPGLPWDEVPQAFNDWWNADYDPTGNPFEKDTHAYWAWAGWKAAEQPAQHEQPMPVAFWPDALTAQDPETLEYILGWNDCRQLMMEMLKREIK